MHQFFVAFNETLIQGIKNGEIGSWVSPYIVKYGIPQNFATGEKYTSGNRVKLMLSGKVPIFGTFKQINDAGGRVNKGTKGIKLIKYIDAYKHNGKPINQDQYFNLLKQGVKGLEKNIFIKTFDVYSIQDTTGLNYLLEEKPHVEPLKELTEIISGYKNCPKIISERQDVACYYPEIDVINVPLVANIISHEEHASTTLHECAHSTGHETRLKRIGITGKIKKGSPEYAFEELIAELTAIFICVERGINALKENSAAYMRFWLQYFEDDPKFLYNAAKEAQKAANYILGK